MALGTKPVDLERPLLLYLSLFLFYLSSFIYLV